MPRALSYTPSWLSRPSPGFDVFSGRSETKPANGNGIQGLTGPLKTIARRGTEVFVANGKEIRWTDLVLLKENDEGRREQFGDSFSSETPPQLDDDSSYVILRPQVSGQIIQLVMSPREDYLAILTPHTVHIAILPDSTDLTARGGDTMRPKTYQIGPTAHVSENKPVAAALWHPLGERGNCLVTVTEDGIVRLWEVYENDRSSFSEATLAFDLKKLANAASEEENLSRSISRYDQGKNFTPDSFEMEVASACFGGSGRYGEAPWASMTLWIAMKGGDVYALCPLLPSKWQPPSSMVPALSLALKAKVQEQESEGDSWSQEDHYTVDMQAKWIQDIESQDPLLSSTMTAFGNAAVYKRPSRPGPVPKLQGPFLIEPEVDTDFELTDIIVTGLKAEKQDKELADEFDEPDFQEEQQGAGSVVCLLSSSANVIVCLDLDGIEAEWLPQRSSSSSSRRFQLEECTQSLLLLDAISLISNSTVQVCTPAFTADINNNYSFFVTHDLGVSFVSLSSWLDRLVEEMTDGSDKPSDFRVNLLVAEDRYLLEHPISFSQTVESSPAANPAVAVVIEDSDIGYVLIASANNQPYACIFDTPNSLALADDLGDLAITHDELPASARELAEPRPYYQTNQAFYSDLQIPFFIDRGVPERHRRIPNEEIRLSEAASNIMSDAHNIALADTDLLLDAVSELFRWSERTIGQWREVVQKAAEVNMRIDHVIGNSAQDEDFEDRGRDGNEEMDEGGMTREVIERRLDVVRRRRDELLRRYEDVKRKMRGVSAKELSEKEKAWIDEVQSTARDVGEDLESEESGRNAAETKLTRRLEDAKKLAEELVAQGRDVAAQAASDLERSREIKVPDALRRQGVQRVMDLLERENALVERVGERVEELTVRTTG
ncbi:hypothetical protein NA57DRAFT_30977 [Rhizodiscina lignyota]|uniref:Nucleoporin NUP82 n=1 Tax=Rhizodiscina lignyota TaxID=1504668 RepID=A0A9P4MBC0_9PEZI|nr:hypothetical protein NA57DRAFT_30977 [Rhizodiscina lignyota]